MGLMTCAKCKKKWKERGIPMTTICEECKLKEQKKEVEQVEDNSFESMFLSLFEEDELKLINNIDLQEIKLLAAEYAAIQLRWKLIRLKKGSDEK